MLAAISVVANIWFAIKLREIQNRAARIARRPETCTMIAEAIRFLGELAGEKVWAYDPIGFRRQVIIRRGCSTEVYVEQPRM